MEKDDSLNSSNDDILGGIKSAISRGETLKQAMITLYNAGYTKTEIEDSARRYMLGKSEERVYDASYQKTKKEEKEEKKQIAKQEKQNKIDVINQEENAIKNEKSVKQQEIIKNEKAVEEAKKDLKFKQKVSNYDSFGKSTKKKKAEPITITLVLLLLLLIGVLISVFLFKEELVTFFNNLFG